MHLSGRLISSVGSVYEVIDGISSEANRGKEFSYDIMKKATDIYDKSIAEQKEARRMAEEATALIEFMDKTAMQGYTNLSETSESYRIDANDMNQMMESFARESEKIKDNIEMIKEAVDAVNIAVEENANGIVNIADMSRQLTEKISDIEKEADVNKDVADDLNNEVGKFKLE